MTRLLTALAGRADLLSLSLKIPKAKAAIPTTRDHARLDLHTAASAGSSFRFLVSGHTHRSEVVPLSPCGDTSVPIYLNTGTWRRVHCLVEPENGEGRPGFVTWNEDCLISIASPSEQARGLPAFEVRNLLRGAARA